MLQASMVLPAVHSRLREASCRFFDPFSGGGIDQGGLSGHKRGQELSLGLQRLDLQHFDVDVLSLKPLDHDGCVGHTQRFEDVFLDLGSGRGGQSDGGGVSECLSNCSKTQVVGAKVVTPLREAVGFVDGQKAQAAGLEKVHKAIGESLRRDIDQFPMTVSKPDEAIASLHRRDGGIDAGCSNSNFLKGIHLVFHQCNQRRDHQTTAFRGHSRKLVAERFASACWHDNKRVLPSQDLFDNRFLTLAKAGVTKAFFEESL
jgi:hypothetical protein